MGTLFNFCCAVLIASTIAQEIIDKKVVIVGAGLSGYSAAAKFLERGFSNFVVLEADNRIGGRLKTFSIGTDEYLDEGCQWVHGQNIIWQMAQSTFTFGSSKFDNLDPQYCLSSVGCDGTFSEYSSTRDCIDAFAKAASSFSSTTTTTENLEVFTKRNFDAKILSLGISVSSARLEQCKNYGIRGQNAYYGCRRMADVSAQLTSQKTSDAGGDQDMTWNKSGYKTVLEYISKRRPNPANSLNVESKIVLNSFVNNIERVADSEGYEKVLVKCANGKIYRADHVIVTVSVGVLKAQYPTLFTPPLDKDKIKAITSYGFGTINKVFLVFDAAFWSLSTSFLGYSFLWDFNDAKLTEIKSAQRSWLLAVPGLDKVTAYPNMLELFIAGGDATDEFEASDDAKVFEDVLWLLKTQFPTRNFDDATKPGKITLQKIYRSRWQSNPLIRGSYSFMSMDMQTNGITPASLKRPIRDSSPYVYPRILFAGEATSAYKSSFAHGAIETGYSTADSLFEWF